MGLLDRFRRKKDKGKVVAGVTSRPIRKGINFATAAGIPDITQDTNSFRDDSNFDNVYDLYDAMFVNYFWFLIFVRMFISFVYF